MLARTESACRERHLRAFGGKKNYSEYVSGISRLDSRLLTYSVVLPPLIFITSILMCSESLRRYTAKHDHYKAYQSGILMQLVMGWNVLTPGNICLCDLRCQPGC